MIRTAWDVEGEAEQEKHLRVLIMKMVLTAIWKQWEGRREGYAESTGDPVPTPLEPVPC